MEDPHLLLKINRNAFLNDLLLILLLVGAGFGSCRHTALRTVPTNITVKVCASLDIILVHEALELGERRSRLVAFSGTG